MRRLGFLLLAFTSCAKSGAGTSTASARPSVVDTLPSFLERLDREAAPVPDGPMRAWLAYERENHRVLSAAATALDDPGDVRLRKLAVGPAALRALVAAFGSSAGSELDETVERMGELLPAPRVTVAFVVMRSDAPALWGRLDGTPALLVNARHPDLAAPNARRLLFARQLFRAAHQERFPDAALTPIARRLWREGAALLAARQLVPKAREHELLQLDERELARLKAREALVTKELLASLDSRLDTEAARFFDAEVVDPLVPSGAGWYVADKLYQRLAAEMGSATRPLSLPASEFISRARKHLLAMAGR